MIDVMGKRKLFRKNSKTKDVQTAYVLGKERHFSMAEAHKRLRTSVFFSFPEDEGGCRVIGVTSAMAHEGKTTTSINLAYDMMQAGKRVLFVDADMRLSNIANMLGIQRSPGLSEFLVSSMDPEKSIQSAALLDGLHVMPCGSNPPNPSELLSSKRMGLLLDALKAKYEYIIIDLPPIAAVSDALIISKLVDGMVVVVRQDYGDKRLLDDAVRQLQFHEANIIGFVVNCSRMENKYYGKYGRYDKYYRKNKYYHSESTSTGS